MELRRVETWKNVERKESFVLGDRLAIQTEIQDSGLAEKPCLEWWLGVFVSEEGKE